MASGRKSSAAARLVLERVATVFGHQFTFDSRPIGGAALRRGSAPLPDDTVAACLQADAILLGAVGDAAVRQPARRTGGRRRRCCSSGSGSASTRICVRPRVWPGLEDVGPLKPEVLARHRPAGRSRADRRACTTASRAGFQPTATWPGTRCATREAEVERIARVGVRGRAAAQAPRHLGRQGQRARDVAALARCGEPRGGGLSGRHARAHVRRLVRDALVRSRRHRST